MFKWLIGIVTLVLLVPAGFSQSPRYIWVEGEQAEKASQVKRHPWWYDQVKQEEFSGGDFISNWSGEDPGFAVYSFEVPTAGAYKLWLRANPIQSRMSVVLNGQAEVQIEMSSARDNVNVAKDGKPDLRFLSWMPAGTFQLSAGRNQLRVNFTSENNHHGYLDAFAFVQGDFVLSGRAKPDELAKPSTQGEWIAWNPGTDPHTESPIDLRLLNEPEAGSAGRIVVRDGNFVREGDGRQMRFWAVNGPPADLRGDALQYALRDLAKRGVNLIRIHGAIFDKSTGAIREDELDRLQEITARAKKEGIYTHLSIYFPLWFEPQAGLDFLEGYDGKSKPFSALYFNKDFENHYQGWWRRLLTRPGSYGPRLVDEVALMSVELVNEDSFFFWTFKDQLIPEAQLRILEEMFYEWTLKRYGTPEKAYAAWEVMKMKGDQPERQRLDLRPLYDIFNNKSRRDQDTARFLAETQRAFYARQVAFLKDLGFKGLITASNWHTAEDQIFKPLEIWSYLPGDFIDRHGYFGTFAEGENVSWSMRNQHLYADRSALKFESRTPGGPKDFSHPVADPKYNGMPSMISETTWTRPNRYRTEAPLFYAAYGSLQGSDSIVHFAHDSAQWTVKPRFFMQPWTLMSPSQMGQFPATALMYRLGYIAEGKTLASVGLNLDDLFALKGTPLVQKGNLDELRLADVTPGGGVGSGEVIDPRIHFMGKTEVNIGDAAGKIEISSLAPYLDDAQKIIRGSNSQIELDYGKGILKINAPRVEAISGDLRAAGPSRMTVLSVDSSLDLGHVILVSLDGQPLNLSRRMLLQVMTEERNTDWQQQRVGNDGKYRVLNIGKDPWRFKAIKGSVRLNRPDAGQLKVTALDFNGYPREETGNAGKFILKPDGVYYLIQ